MIASSVVVAVSGPLAGASFATVDLTGNWDVTRTTMFGSITSPWQIVQTGTSLSIGSPPFYTGTIDPNTGALSFGGLVCDGITTGPESFTGSAALDSEADLCPGDENGNPVAC